MKKIKTPKELYEEHGFRESMLLPIHLVEMLMNQYHDQFKNIQIILTDESIELKAFHSSVENEMENRDYKLGFKNGYKQAVSDKVISK